MIIEAVPNFSEGRRPEVIAAIVAALTVDGVLVLDVNSDVDHNRTVVTVAGPADAVVEGLFAAIQTAARQIDLFEHQGEHPRLGATDVVPLVPLENSSLAECADLAVRLGERVGRELELPVYLYEAAARRPERRDLADVRRGQFERLLQEIESPARRPDFGPARVGGAGAVIIGARTFLIAYNFFLASQDVLVARRIAKRIRQSSGGLPGVKAIGLLVNGQAQVSINLVDFTLSSLAEVTERVKQLAEAFGASLERAELIGLLPQQAILDAAAHYLQLPHLESAQILESALHMAGKKPQPL